MFFTERKLEGRIAELAQYRYRETKPFSGFTQA